MLNVFFSYAMRHDQDYWTDAIVRSALMYKSYLPNLGLKCEGTRQ